MGTKLLPCPFCGGEDLVLKLTSEDGFTSIGCLNDHSFFGIMVQANTEAEAIEAWNTRHERTCDGCKHLATSMRVDYHIDPCCECVRNAPDLYEPKEETDAD